MDKYLLREVRLKAKSFRFTNVAPDYLCKEMPTYLLLVPAASLDHLSGPTTGGQHYTLIHAMLKHYST